MTWREVDSNFIAYDIDDDGKDVYAYITNWDFIKDQALDFWYWIIRVPGWQNAMTSEGKNWLYLSHLSFNTREEAKSEFDEVFRS
jgi:hypothetical protein